MHLTAYSPKLQLIKIMKLTTILLLAAFLQVSAKGLTQEVSLRLQNIPIEKAFKEIEKQTGYTFVYTKERIATIKPVSITAEKKQLDAVLQQLFKDQQLTYSISGKYISIKQTAVKSSETFTPVNINVTGTVTNDKGEKVAGASVLVKGTQRGVSTNEAGVFTLENVDDRATLIISGVNIETTEINIDKRTVLSVNVKIKVSELNEIIVGMGYYEQKQRNAVGNAVRVTAAEIEKQPVTNPLLALQGRVPGLNIVQNTGVPGGGVTVRINGISSIRNGLDPLYVVDGIPIPSQLNVAMGTGSAFILGNSGGQVNGGSTGVGNPLSFINPSDIESIDILKDADATTIYGSRAANGAIVITTKKGKAGLLKLDLNIQQGWGKVARFASLLNARQYLDMRYEAFKNDGLAITSAANNDLRLWDTTRNTDWQRTLIGGTALFSQINLGISGGGTNVQYNIGTTLNTTGTVFPGETRSTNGAVHFNIGASSLNQRFKISLTGNYSSNSTNLPANDYTNVAMTTSPVAPSLYNSDGTLNWAPTASGTSSWTNPLASQYKIYKRRMANLIANSSLSYQITTGLTASLKLGYTSMNSDGFLSETVTKALRPEQVATAVRTANYDTYLNNTWIIEPQISYNHSFGKVVDFDLLTGGTLQQTNNRNDNLSGSGYPSDIMVENPSAATSLFPFNRASEYKYSGVFTRTGFNIKNRYLINLSVRRDGSSRFGENSQFHNFWSIGGGWIVSEEKFFSKIPVLSFLKLRANYGTTGNDNIADFSYLSTYNVVPAVGVPYQGSTSFGTSVLPNPYLQWEETKKFQIGADLGLLNDRIRFNLTYIDNQSSNQLVNYPLPLISGGSGSITLNSAATIKNTSLEIGVQSTNIKTPNFTWTTGFNITIPRNKVTSFPGIENTSYASGTQGIIVGQPIGVIRAYKYLGVDPMTGQYVFEDRTGNPTSSFLSFPADAPLLLSTLPKFYGGFQNSFTYKQFEIDLLFQFQKQLANNSIIAQNDLHAGTANSLKGNQLTSLLDRWQKPGDISSIARVSTFNTTGGSYIGQSDFSLADASYIRLKNVSVSYQLPEKLTRKAGMSRAAVYIQAQNLLTITNYKGLDPENQGNSRLPPLRMITVGAKLTF